MLSVDLTRADPAPIQMENFSTEFEKWVTTFIDSLNESINQLQEAINTIGQYVSNDGLTAPSKTTAEITALAVTAPEGSLWYDVDTAQIKAKSNGIVVVVV